mgnify:CR=1 FL=1
MLLFLIWPVSLMPMRLLVPFGAKPKLILSMLFAVLNLENVSMKPDSRAWII